jgi:hypothetical protein
LKNLIREADFRRALALQRYKEDYMARMPDFLSNMLTKDTNLADDSPEFRQKYQEMQKNNLVKAANSAMNIVDDRIRQSKMQRMQADMQELDRITPIPVPLSGPDERFFDETAPDVSTPMSPNIPGPTDFDVASPDRTVIPPPDPAMTTAMDQPADPGMSEVAEINRISQETGIPVQQVAAMTLLVRDINNLEKEGALPPIGSQMPPPPAPMPTPLSGPVSAPPAPMMGASGTQPSPPLPPPVV